MGFPRAAFYCVVDSRYFLGAAALINSLRLLGHDEPVFVLDCGLTESQRELVVPHATIVPAPDDTPPWLLKAAAPLRHPAEVMVLVDADVVVTRPLTELVQKAARPSIVAFRNGSNRFVPEWGELLKLGTARPRPYVSSSLVLLGGSLGIDALHLMEGLQNQVDFDRTFWRTNVPDYPFLLADQDLLNAILATRVDPDRVVELEDRLEAVPPFAGLRVIDEGSLRCAYADGTRPYMVHHFLPVKPWLESTMPGVYTQLLVRLLGGSDVAIQVPRRELPLHLRPGLRAGAERWYRGPFLAGVQKLRGRAKGVSELLGG
jgi:hypothetical protein